MLRRVLGRSDRDELRPGADAQNRVRAGARLNRQAEEVPIKIDGPLRVGYRQTKMAQRAHADR